MPGMPHNWFVTAQRLRGSVPVSGVQDFDAIREQVKVERAR
jgi:hypothetical protein